MNLKLRILNFNRSEFAAWKSSFVLMALAFANTLLQAICFFLLFQKIGVVSFGEYRTFLSFASFSGLFHLGFADGLFLKWIIEKHQPRQHQLFTVIGITAILSLLLLYTNLPPSQIIFLIAYVIIANITFFLHSAFVQAGVFSTSLVFNLVIQSFLTIYLLVAEDGLDMLSVLKMVLLFQIIGTFFLFFYSSKRQLLKPESRNCHSYKSVLSTIGKGLPVLLGGSFFLAIFNLDKIFLAGRFDENDFGNYAFASSIVSIGIGVMSAPINLVLTRMANVESNFLSAVYSRLFNYIWILGILSLVGVRLVFLLLHFWNDTYDKALPYAISWSTIFFPMMVLQMLLSNIYKRLGIQRVFLFAAIAAVAIMLVIIFIYSGMPSGLRILPLAISQLLIVMIVVLESLLRRQIPDLKDGQLIRLCMIAVFNILLWVTYAI